MDKDLKDALNRIRQEHATVEHILAAHADHEPRHYTFQRRQSLYSPPLTPTPAPLAGWGQSTIAAVLVLLFVAAAFWAGPPASAVLRAVLQWP